MGNAASVNTLRTPTAVIAAVLVGFGVHLLRTDYRRSHHRSGLQSFIFVMQSLAPRLPRGMGLLIAAYTAVLCLRIRLGLEIARLGGSLGGLLLQSDWEALAKQQTKVALLALPLALSEAASGWVEWTVVGTLRSALQAVLHDQYFTPTYPYKTTNLPPSTALSCTHQHKHVQAEHRRKREQQLQATPLSAVDHRITLEVGEWSHEVVHVYGHSVRALLDIGVCTVSLLPAMSAKPLMAYLGYFLCSYVVLNKIKPALWLSVKKQQEAESAFRHHHSKVAQYAEEIAFLQGEASEKQLSNAIFAEVQKLQHQSRLWNFLADFLDNCVLKYGGSVVGSSLLIPGALAARANGDPPSLLTQHYLTNTSLLLSLGGSLKDLILQYKTAIRLSGSSTRLQELLVRLNTITHVPETEEPQLASRTERIIRLSDLDVITPSGEVVLKDVNWKVSPFQHTLVTGPNGAGKTSLFRVLGGLWEVAGGRCDIPRHDVRFVPQRCYLGAGGGTLLSLVVYPDIPYDNPLVASPLPPRHVYMDKVDMEAEGHEGCVHNQDEEDDEKEEEGHAHCDEEHGHSHGHGHSHSHGEGEDTNKQKDDKSQKGAGKAVDLSKEPLSSTLRMDDVMRALELSGLMPALHKHGLHMWRSNWANTLSGGEAQRVAIARVFYHRPAFAILDEATSSLSSEYRDRVYENCASLGMTVLAIAHPQGATSVLASPTAKASTLSSLSSPLPSKQSASFGVTVAELERTGLFQQSVALTNRLEE